MNKTHQELCDELRVANERVAALSAHIGRLVATANDAISQPGSCMMVAQWERTVKEAPETSLESHNLLQKAEALDEEAGFHSDPAIQDSLRISAEQLRILAGRL